MWFDCHVQRSPLASVSNTASSDKKNNRHRSQEATEVIQEHCLRGSISISNACESKLSRIANGSRVGANFPGFLQEVDWEDLLVGWTGAWKKRRNVWCCQFSWQDRVINNNYIISMGETMDAVVSWWMSGYVKNLVEIVKLDILMKFLREDEDVGFSVR